MAAQRIPAHGFSAEGGAFFTVGYNAWKNLDTILDALEENGVDILIDTRAGDFGRYRYRELAASAAQHTGHDGKPMRFAPRPALTGKPLAEAEYTPAGQADYRVMDERPAAKQVLDGMAQAVENGQRIAVLCACKDTCACHRTRWIAEAMDERGIEAGHLEPGLWRERDEEGQVKWTVTPHRELRGTLPHHSDVNWREKSATWDKKKSPTLKPTDYHSPESTRPLPEKPHVVMIAGSMNANPAQLNYASDLVERAATIGAEIYVGDNPKGVDQRVIDTANAIGYSHVLVWSPERQPRNGGIAGGRVRHYAHNPYVKGNQYTQRDRAMIDAVPDNGACFFLSNGETHYQSGAITGTEAGYVFAIGQGKAVKKIVFDQPHHRREALKPLPGDQASHKQTDQHHFELRALPLHDPTQKQQGYSTAFIDRTSGDKTQTIHVIELARFQGQTAAQHHADSLKSYMLERGLLSENMQKDDMKLASLFAQKVARHNGLDGQPYQLTPAESKQFRANQWHFTATPVAATPDIEL